MPQNIELFSKSIYDNIRVSRRNATLDEVKEAAKAADAHDFIKKLPMQYYTYLEEAGNGLSGGEKQRIALATVKNCDEIIVMNQGEIVEQGSHEELLARKGEYYRLWEMQQGNFVVREEAEIQAKVQVPEFDEDEMSYT